MDRFDIWGVTCILVACGFFGSALRIYTKRKKFLAIAVPAAGTVIEVHVRGVGRNAVSFPVFEFRTTEGTLQRAESLMGSGFRGFQVGETVPVRYDPADPSQAEVDTFVVLWGLVLLRVGFAVIFLGMGIVGLLL